MMDEWSRSSAERRRGYSKSYRRPPAARYLGHQAAMLFERINHRQQSLGQAQPILTLQAALPSPLPPRPPLGLARTSRPRPHAKVVAEIRRSPPCRHHPTPDTSLYGIPRLIERRVDVIKRLRIGRDAETCKSLDSLIAVVLRLGEQGLSINDSMQTDAYRILQRNGNHVGQTVKTIKFKAGMHCNSPSAALADSGPLASTRAVTPLHRVAEDGDGSAAATAALQLPIVGSSYVRRQQHLHARMVLGGALERPATSPVWWCGAADEKNSELRLAPRRAQLRSAR